MEPAIALDRNQNFDEMLKVLERALTFEEFPGFSGCCPCSPASTRFTIQSRTPQP